MKPWRVKCLLHKWSSVPSAHTELDIIASTGGEAGSLLLAGQPVKPNHIFSASVKDSVSKIRGKYLRKIPDINP